MCWELFYTRIYTDDGRVKPKHLCVYKFKNMKKYIIITADTNDGDYITEKSEITDEVIEAIKPIIEQFKIRKKKLEETKDWNNWRHNWETSEYGRLGDPKKMYVDKGLLTQEQVDIFNEFVPHGENGIHTVESIEILVVQEEIKLF